MVGLIDGRETNFSRADASGTQRGQRRPRDSSRRTGNVISSIPQNFRRHDPETLFLCLSTSLLLLCLCRTLNLVHLSSSSSSFCLLQNDTLRSFTFPSQVFVVQVCARKRADYKPSYMYPVTAQGQKKSAFTGRCLARDIRFL